MTSHSRPVATPCPILPPLLKRNNIEQENPHLSRACIRSLLKQLCFSSSAARPKSAQRLSTMSTATSQDQQQQEKQLQQGHEQAPPKPQVKKQVRRRMHTSRPYQERLLNMAEARREIVSALRIHRANMRQQSIYQQEQLQQRPFLQLQQQQQQEQLLFQEPSQAVEGVPVAMSYASFSNHFLSSPLEHLIAAAPAGSYSFSMVPYDIAPLEAPAAIGDLECHGLEHLACRLPAQPLGLNLSFQGFGGSVYDAKNSGDLIGVPLVQSTKCASSFPEFSSPVMVMEGTHGSPAFCTAENVSSTAFDAPSPSREDREMLSIGEKHGMEMEWSETAAADVAAASVWWSKILESVESGGCRESAMTPRPEGGTPVGMAEDEVAGALPEWQWLCDGELGATGDKPDVLEMRVDDGDYNCCYRGDHSDDGEDVDLLPRMDIGDIEGWNGEWFS